MQNTQIDENKISNSVSLKNYCIHVAFPDAIEIDVLN